MEFWAIFNWTKVLFICFVPFFFILEKEEIFFDNFFHKNFPLEIMQLLTQIISVIFFTI